MDLRDILGIERYLQLSADFIDNKGDNGNDGASNQFEIIQSNYRTIFPNTNVFGLAWNMPAIDVNDTLYCIYNISHQGLTVLNIDITWQITGDILYSINPTLGCRAYIFKLNSDATNANRIVVNTLNAIPPAPGADLAHVANIMADWKAGGIISVRMITGAATGLNPHLSMRAYYCIQYGSI